MWDWLLFFLPSHVQIQAKFNPWLEDSFAKTRVCMYMDMQQEPGKKKILVIFKIINDLKFNTSLFTNIIHQLWLDKHIYR